MKGLALYKKKKSIFQASVSSQPLRSRFACFALLSRWINRKCPFTLYSGIFIFIPSPGRVGGVLFRVAPYSEKEARWRLYNLPIQIKTHALLLCLTFFIVSRVERRARSVGFSFFYVWPAFGDVIVFSYQQGDLAFSARSGSDGGMFLDWKKKKKRIQTGKNIS